MFKKLSLLFLILFQLSALACINTSYSRDDEIEITDELVHIILGQFAHHGPAFYQREVEVNQKKLSENDQDFDARNDLAAALLKLGKYDEAEKEFLKNEKLHPQRYKTQSNLAVLYKKTKKFKKAAEHLRQALKIQPEGHMGLGDYYLRMIEWLDKNHGKEELATHNFLGLPYDMPPEKLIKQPHVRQDYIVTLIKNDMSFADAYIILGDLLVAQGKRQLALRAYWRAYELLTDDAEKKNREVKGKFHADTRMDIVIAYWEKNKEQGYIVSDNWYHQLRREVSSASKWLENFQAVESNMILAQKTISFPLIIKEMKSLGLTRSAVLEAAYYKGTKHTRGELRTYLPIFITLFMILAVIIWAFWKIMRYFYGS